jgi:hypothetical protein
MSDFLQDDRGDLAFTDNELTFVIGADEVAQRVTQRLRTFRGEWFLDLDIGVPYYQEILIKNPSSTIVEGRLKTEITETPGVLEIEVFELDIDNAERTATVDTRIISVDGPIELEVQTP